MHYNLDRTLKSHPPFLKMILAFKSASAVGSPSQICLDGSRTGQPLDAQT